MFCYRPADKVGDCVTPDTRCNRGWNNEVFCENITWIEMFPYSISCMFAQLLISVNSYNTLSIAGAQCQQGKTAKPRFSLCHAVVKDRSETPSFYLDHDVLGRGGDAYLERVLSTRPWF